ALQLLALPAHGVALYVMVSAPPIVAALGLMSVTVVLLAYYLAANDPMALAFTAAVYLSTTVAHVTFERLRRGSG
ncbi:MAG: hypothetical protein P8Y10_15695, partial [Gemmatimonadales bacterium]